VADFAHHFGVTVEPGSAATVGGLVIEKLRRIPAVGDKVAVGPLTLQVDEMDGPRIAALSATRAGGD
jgi:CBS domain containing-hemolysin-like protein